MILYSKQDFLELLTFMYEYIAYYNGLQFLFINT